MTGSDSKKPPQGSAPAQRRLRRTVALVGMMGSGKTAVGKALAARLGAQFLDSDAAIEEAAKATIPEIFARDGESFFRDREAEVIARLLSGPPVVLSTGGGAFMADRNREAIARAGVALWLDADLDTLWERVRHKDSRPLLRTSDPKGTLAEIYERRVPVYRLAGLHVRSEPGCSVEETASRALSVLATRPDILESP
ncbi:shikimate kinase [Rubellimicrobium roseum]|uniref:Shikimate kinase n=1 Tax=Rubellimicrobium roseum TaxID=687525 RepID=A0A5C4NCG4_9RHOB|nr:shikimate kinase [Rubellimicrobium roseum]TNC69520.1 shikimate kinase [Rubellimicrobium roseum]